MPKTEAFDKHIAEYEQWFIDNHFVFQSELVAIRNVIPAKGKGVEIGVGSGIFASMLGIKDGVEPSFAMRNKAIGRQIKAVDGIAEELPYPDKSYDYALMVTTICFVDDISKSFREVHRILKKNGKFIIGFVDKNSPVGRTYFENKSKSVFYTDAVFYSCEEVYRHLWENNYKIDQTWQTVFGTLQEICEIQTPEKGYGRGSFVVIQAIKNE